MRNTKF